MEEASMPSLPGISAVWMGSRGNGAFYPVQAAQLRKDDLAGGKHTDSTDETSQEFWRIVDVDVDFAST